MADPNIRHHVANATSAALPPFPNGACIGDIAADMADVMLSIAAESAPSPKRPRGPQGWCAEPGVQAEMNAAWQQSRRRGAYAQAPTMVVSEKPSRPLAKTSRKFAKPLC